MEHDDGQLHGALNGRSRLPAWSQAKLPLAIGVLIALAASTVSATAGFTDEFREAQQRTANRDHGRSLYAACALCHQPDGGGRAAAGVPNIAGQHARVILEQLINYREFARLDDRMELAAGRHALRGSQDLADVAAYVADLAPVATVDVGPGQFLDEGKTLYARDCSHCHGATAEGNARLRFPRLAGQHYRYLTWQITFMQAGDRMTLSREHVRLLGEFSPDDISGIAGYLARLR